MGAWDDLDGLVVDGGLGECGKRRKRGKGDDVTHVLNRDIAIRCLNPIAVVEGGLRSLQDGGLPWNVRNTWMWNAVQTRRMSMVLLLSNAVSVIRTALSIQPP